MKPGSAFSFQKRRCDMNAYGTQNARRKRRPLLVRVQKKADITNGGRPVNYPLQQQLPVSVANVEEIRWG
jgi:hypothetical protein